MKRIYLSLTTVLFAVILNSCTKNDLVNIDQPLPANSAQIKYYNFGVNAPSVNYYANSVKVAATLSATGAESTAGITSGSVYPVSNYSLLSGGTYEIKAQLPSTVIIDPNLVINSFNATIENNKYYSYYTCGIYNTTTKKADAFMIEDKLPAIDYNVAYVRFVNTVPNAPSNFNLYVRNTLITPATDVLVATNIPYKGASEFITVSGGTYELYARYSTTPTVNTIPRNGTVGGATVAFAPGKVYTISSRGDITVSTAGTATNRPLLDNTANR